MKRFISWSVVFSALILFSANANAWFIFFLPGSATQAVSDAITGSEGEHCVGPNAKVGDQIRLPNGSILTIKSLSGTSSRCQDASLPIRAMLGASSAPQLQSKASAAADRDSAEKQQAEFARLDQVAKAKDDATNQETKQLQTQQAPVVTAYQDSRVRQPVVDEQQKTLQMQQPQDAALPSRPEDQKKLWNSFFPGEITPEFRAWNAENIWFGADRAKTEFSLLYAKQLRQDHPDLVGRAFFDTVTAKVKNTFSSEK